jgi:hypothetical protein
VTDEWIEMQPAPIRVRQLFDEWEVRNSDGSVDMWSEADFLKHGLTPPEPPPAPVVVTVELTAVQAEKIVLLFGDGQDDYIGGPAGEACVILAAAIREQLEGEGPATGYPFGRDTPKMVRETLCVAQAAMSDRADDGRKTEHIARLQRLIDICDEHRPLGPNGKHGDRHTPTCGCDR